jgi:hypothetical protein
MGSVFGVSLALLAGYVYVRTSYYRRFSCEHLRTDRFALHLLAFSFVLYLAGAFASELLPDWGWKPFKKLRDDAEKVGVSVGLINAVLFAVLYGFYENIKLARRLGRDPHIAGQLPNKINGRMRLAAQLKYVKKSTDATLRLMFRAVLLNKLVQVTLKSGKVYVGRLRWPDFDPAHPLTTVNLVPFFSGYRDSTTRKVVVTTKYDDLFYDLEPLPDEELTPPVSVTNPLRTDIWLLSRNGAEPARIDIEDLGVVLALSEVTSLSLYDQAIYEWFQGQPPAAPSVVAGS